MTSQGEEQRLITKYVFIDTEVYYRGKFDWSSKIFQSLLERIANGTLVLLTTDVIRKEIDSGIVEAVKAAHIVIEKASRGSVIVQQFRPETLAGLISVDEKSILLDEARRVTMDFFSAAAPVDLPLPDRALETVLDMYFGGRPPFHNGKKKNEFPDAANVVALRSWAKENQSKVYVVSGDSDITGCCSPDGPLIWVNSLSEVLSAAIRVEADFDQWDEETLLNALRLEHERISSAIEVWFEQIDIEVDFDDGVDTDRTFNELTLEDVYVLSRISMLGPALRFDLEVNGFMGFDVEVRIWDEAQRTDLEFEVSCYESITLNIVGLVRPGAAKVLEIDAVSVRDPTSLSVYPDFDF